MNKIAEVFKAYFAAGLLVIVPFVVSVWLLSGIVIWVDEIFAVNRWSPVVVPGIGLLIAILLILLAGAFGRNVLGSWLVSNLSGLMKRVPVLGSVYGALSQTLSALFSGSDKKFNKAVLVEYPRAGSWTVALVTSDKAPPVIQQHASEPLISLYVPTTPNPTSGFLLFVPRSQTKELNIKVDDALKLVISLGLVEGENKVTGGN